MEKNPGGLRCIVTMQSRKMSNDLSHCFLLISKVFTKPTDPTEPTGMFETKLIFATDVLKSHKDIDKNIWRRAQKTFMCFQPLVISADGALIKSHVMPGDIREDDTCWNQTCRLKRCEAAVFRIVSGSNGSVGQKRKASADISAGGSEEEVEEEQQDEKDGQMAQVSRGQSSLKSKEKNEIFTINTSSEDEAESDSADSASKSGKSKQRALSSMSNGSGVAIDKPMKSGFKSVVAFIRNANGIMSSCYTVVLRIM